MELRIAPKMTTMQKLEILTDAAKYDVACTSSGVERKGTKYMEMKGKKQKQK